MIRRGRLPELGAGWLFFGALLLLWEWYGRNDTTAFVVPFSLAAQEAWTLVTSSTLTTDILPSVGRVLLGFAIGGAVGTVVGVLLGWSKVLEPWCRGALEFLRAVPPPAVVPIALLVLGASSWTRIGIIAFGSLWPVLLAAFDGTRRVEAGYIDAGRIYSNSRGGILWRVALPAALPQIMTGLRVGLAISLIMMVVSEMVSSTSGLGYLILQSQRMYNLPQMYAGVLILGLVGWLLALCFTRIESRVLVWFEGQKGLERA